MCVLSLISLSRSLSLTHFSLSLSLPKGFTPLYDSLSHEIVVDGYFLRLLIPELENNNPEFVVKQMSNPKSLLRAIYNRLVVEDDEERRFIFIYTMRGVKIIIIFFFNSLSLSLAHTHTHKSTHTHFLSHTHTSINGEISCDCE